MSRGIFLFEAFIVLITLALLFSMRKNNPKLLRRYLIIVIGVLIFEVFTNPLWHNLNMGAIAYLYRDVSWILTLGWSTILITSMEMVDYLFPSAKDHVKFFIYLLFSAILGIILETIVIVIGIRAFAPEIIGRFSGINIPFSPVPIEAIYYLTVFMALIIGFTRYFEMCFDKEQHKPVKKRKK